MSSTRSTPTGFKSMRLEESTSILLPEEPIGLPGFGSSINNNNFGPTIQGAIRFRVIGDKRFE